MNDTKPDDPSKSAEGASDVPGASVNPYDDRPAAKSSTAAESTQTGEQGLEGELDAALAGDFSVEQLRTIIVALQDELQKKAADVASKHDQLLRAMAETENVRRRLEKEKDLTAKYAITKFAMDVLTVGDNFQRAIDAVPKDAVEADPALKTLIDGVVLAEKDFVTALERHGVKSLDPPVGQPFNPHCHQAVMEQENAEVPPGTVLRVFQAGYMIDDRCLRPAMVVVSKSGAKAAKPAEGAAATPANDGT